MVSSYKMGLAKPRKWGIVLRISVRKQRSLCSVVRVFQKALGKGRKGRNGKIQWAESTTSYEDSSIRQDS